MVSLADIRHAQVLIAPHIIRTPLVYSPTISAMAGAEVYLKLETLQKAGSFKVRGATCKILSCPERCKEHGVIAASAGNHAQGVAIAAQRAGIPATIVMPEWTSIAKQEATRGYGANVIIAGLTLEESIEQAVEIAREGGLFIHPYDDEEVIAGQGTMALEILHDLPDADMIVVPVGGGGLIAGIAIAAKGLRPDISIIGAQAKACPSAYEALKTVGPVRVAAGQTIADGIRVMQTGAETLPVLQELVDRIALASEDEIADAMLLLMERKHVIAEGAGATPLAAFLNGSIPVKPGSRVVLVISGGNVDSPQLFRILRQSLLRHGRIVRFSVLLDDQPGTLARLLFTIAKEKGNILSIQHIQGESDTAAYQARVDLELETRGMEHVHAIKKALGDLGYLVRGG
ncbi:MAG: threonine ammonia-lyase [Methanoregula sp.]